MLSAFDLFTASTIFFAGCAEVIDTEASTVSAAFDQRNSPHDDSLPLDPLRGAYRHFEIGIVFGEAFLDLPT